MSPRATLVAIALFVTHAIAVLRRRLRLPRTGTQRAIEEELRFRRALPPDTTPSDQRKVFRTRDGRTFRVQPYRLDPADGTARNGIDAVHDDQE